MNAGVSELMYLLVQLPQVLTAKNYVNSVDRLPVIPVILYEGTFNLECRSV